MKNRARRLADALLHSGPGYDTGPGPDRRQDEVAYRIRAELVCCDLYDRVNLRKEMTFEEALKSVDWHDLCYWGEAAAQIAEGRCPGYETTPNICRCGCDGCKSNCSAHTKWVAPEGGEHG